MVAPAPAPQQSVAEPPTNGQPAAAQADLAQLLESAAARIGGALGELRTLANVRSDRLLLRLRRHLEGLQDAIVWWSATLALTLAGIALVAIGLTGALRAVFAQRPWLAELLAGALLLAIALALRFGRRALAERRAIRRLERKYAELESPVGSAAPSAPSGASARSR